MVLIDLDHFKQVNDDLGHLEGDRILRRAAETISKSIRPTLVTSAGALADDESDEGIEKSA